jgi:PBSX family phage terminase large subunit
MTIVEGCISSGKTFICNHKAIKFIVCDYTNTGLIIFAGRTLTTLERNVLAPLKTQYGDLFRYSLNRKQAFFCGVRIELEGCNDIKAEWKIRGSTAEFVYGDELTAWNCPFLVRCMGSLRTPNAVFLGTTNPDAPSNFVKTDFLDRKEELGLWSLKFGMDDNPTLTEEYKKQVDREYVGVFHDRFIKGLWTLAEGLVYPNYQSAIVPTAEHAYSEYQISCDYGIYNPTVFGLYGKSGDVWYKIKEYYHSGREGKQKTDDEYYADLERFIGELPVKRVIVDPSAASFITLIRRKGRFRVINADNDVADGIRLTATALSKNLLKINDCCANTVAEFSAYVWDSDSGEDRPIKDADHAMDETRYFVYTNRIGEIRVKTPLDGIRGELI